LIIEDREWKKTTPNSLRANQLLYDFLEKSGYKLIFKPTLEFSKDKKKQIKGNVDAELVLHVMIELTNFSKAVIVSGDGDFHCLVEYLVKKQKLESVIIPNFFKFSALLRKFMPYLTFLNELQGKLEYKKEALTFGRNLRCGLLS
jgi:uncharacterized LabA/DUF88 family protein